AAVPVQALLAPQAEAPVIRLSAGTATARFLADRFARLSRPGDGFRLNFVTTEAVLDIAHREIDLGIRNRPAEGGNLASRPLGQLRFAPYRSWAVPRPELLDWVAMDPAQARHPAAHWVLRQGGPVRAFAGQVATLHDLVRSGAGIAVMPCVIGDSDPALVRAGPLIEELTEWQHLVMHADDRHLPPQRRLIERLVALYRDNAELLAGARPLRGAGDE
ncbi:LysR substrate-binding domain-containing protein, partial [Xinfangfangia pollutisoli]|uniref:LysR substrate-binding domain-containing protein n=1 Tax=Xinfangfangia pollutisoli TaxID=2865960 RepID=UPI001CD44DB0